MAPNDHRVMATALDVQPRPGRLRCSVIVPSYGRPQVIRRCLAALSRQTRSPDEVLVVVRDSDEATRVEVSAFAAEYRPLRMLTIREPGSVAALNLALTEARGEIISFTDDDAEPWPDWLERIHHHFASEPDLGALGGRDWLYAGGVLLQSEARVVGHVQWVGRMVGNHHLGVGPAREVEVIKGANMSFRRDALAGLWFDRRLKGGDAEWFMEPGLVFAVKRRGWKVVYDPAVAIDHHHPASRLAADRDRSVARTYSRVFNETLVLLEYLPRHRRAAFLPWAFLVGQRESPGLAQWIRYLLTGRPAATRRLALAWRARLDALRVFQPGRQASDGSN
jgi:cellulose synthase/poly-beta-1,6-N-acetylglucosamine synthase-like glycosyltransferase